MGESDAARVDVAALLDVARGYDALADTRRRRRTYPPDEPVVRRCRRGPVVHRAGGRAAALGRARRRRDAAVVPGVRRNRLRTKGFRRPVRRSRRSRRTAVGVTVSGGFDVAGRLAEGVPSVERIGAYVWACRQLGYQHPDLTAHPAQIRDWYGHEDGLDLRALDADCAALSAAAAAADDALTRHTVLTAELAGAWSGTGAGAAREFLRRQGQSAIDVRDGLRHAADAMATLRDELWRAVDAKVGTVLDIDDRRLAQRAEWLAAAQTVTTGAGDRAAASELVDQQIKPFVDNDIRSDWLAAMQRATASVTGAYDAALAGVGGGSAASFDVPGELGPRWEELPGSTTHGTTAQGATVPAAAFTPTPVVSGAPPTSVAEPVPPIPGPPAPAPAAAARTAHRPDVRRGGARRTAVHALARDRGIRPGSAACRPHRRPARVVGEWTVGVGRPRSGRRPRSHRRHRIRRRRRRFRRGRRRWGRRGRGGRRRDGDR